LEVKTLGAASGTPTAAKAMLLHHSIDTQAARVAAVLPRV
jgi:hypothetical protein